MRKAEHTSVLECRTHGRRSNQMDAGGNSPYASIALAHHGTKTRSPGRWRNSKTTSHAPKLPPARRKKPQGDRNDSSISTDVAALAARTTGAVATRFHHDNHRSREGIADSGWSRIDEHGVIKPNVQPSKAHIMRAKTPPLSHR